MILRKNPKAESELCWKIYPNYGMIVSILLNIIWILIRPVVNKMAVSAAKYLGQYMYIYVLQSTFYLEDREGGPTNHEVVPFGVKYAHVCFYLTQEKKTRTYEPNSMLYLSVMSSTASSLLMAPSQVLMMINIQQ